MLGVGISDWQSFEQYWIAFLHRRFSRGLKASLVLETDSEKNHVIVSFGTKRKVVHYKVSFHSWRVLSIPLNCMSLFDAASSTVNLLSGRAINGEERQKVFLSLMDETLSSLDPQRRIVIQLWLATEGIQPNYGLTQMRSILPKYNSPQVVLWSHLNEPQNSELSNDLYNLFSMRDVLTLFASMLRQKRRSIFWTHVSDNFLLFKANGEKCTHFVRAIATVERITT